MDSYIDRILAEMQREPDTAPATENAFDNTYLGRLPLAMAYVPFQRWEAFTIPLVPCKGNNLSRSGSAFCGRELI